ncbi:MAG: iron donor protein CyaY [Acidobacteria bacterium]|nr:iron donor protein CyaY [Acidobacteriota bacterium]
MIDEAVFRRAADGALESLFKALSRACDTHDFEADMNNGALTVEFDDPPAKFVVSPNTPVRQIWVSAHSKSFKLDWNGSAFVLPETGQTLAELIGEHIGKRLGEEVTL